MTKRLGTYELQEDRLYVNGERVGIDHRVVREVVRQYQAETGHSLMKFVPFSLVERILSVDRAIGLARLKAHLHSA